MTGFRSSREVVMVLPATSVSDVVHVVKGSATGGVRSLDDLDFRARQLQAKEVRRTYQVLESRTTRTGTTGSGARWWLSRTTVVCQWLVPRHAARDRVVLARFDRRWLETGEPSLADAIEHCADHFGLHIPRDDIDHLLSRARPRREP
jgi:hypothetical protein